MILDQYELKFKKLDPDAIMPTKATEEAAGMDLYSTVDAIIAPGHSAMISSGLGVEIPKGFFGAIYARSGLSTREGIRPSNCVGIIDSDYRGPIGLPLYNDSDKLYRVLKGDRVAQLIVQPYLNCVPVEVDALRKTERGANGFGSSGK